jgi:hypothetical protein
MPAPISPRDGGMGSGVRRGRAHRSEGGRARRGASRCVLAATLSIAFACNESDPARSAADRFVDGYYVEIDLPRAKDEAVGLARAKVERAIELLEGVARPETDAKPTIYYRMVEERRGRGDRPGFIYELTISFGGGPTITRRALVIVREEGGLWRAANFEELD